MADALVDLVTSDEVEAHLLAASATVPDDDVLALLITAVSAHLASYLSRDLVSQVHTDTFSGANSNVRILPNYPVTAVASVSVDGISIPARPTVTGSGFVRADNAVHLAGYRFERGVQNCAITYTAGYTTIPTDLKLACLEGIRSSLAAIEREAGVQALKAGDTSITFAGASIVARQCLTPAITALLVGYARVYPA